MSAENTAIVRRLYEEVWNKRNLKVIHELISPSHALQGPNIFGTSVGPEAYKHQVSRFLEGYPDLRWTIEDTIADKDKVVACWTISGTHQGNFMGVPATGKKIFVDGMTIHQIAAGKIMDSHSIWDSLGMMQQLGAVPSVGKAKDASAP